MSCLKKSKEKLKRNPRKRTKRRGKRLEHSQIRKELLLKRWKLDLPKRMSKSKRKKRIEGSTKRSVNKEKLKWKSKRSLRDRRRLKRNRKRLARSFLKLSSMPMRVWVLLTRE